MADTHKQPLLIVDDDLALAKSLQKIMQKDGYEAEHAPTGKDALASFAKGTHKIVLIDIGLPDMNGIELLRQLKEANPDLGAIMMTGNADTETAVKALNQGAFAYIQKPYNINEVKSIIQKVVDKQRLVDENKALLKRLQEWNFELERSVNEKTAELQEKNITLLQVIEKLKVLNEAKSRFVANASHELQTPMTSILGFSSMLLDHWQNLDKAQILRFLQIIRDEGQRLARLSRDLLDLAKIQEGRTVVKIEPVNLEDIANDVRDGMKMIKGSVAIDIAFDAGAKKISSDKDKIKQVFTNLVGNALKYSPDDSRVRIEGKDKGKIVIVHIIDQGPGIPEDQREKIFEPFFRIIDDVGDKIRGTGLGLPIAKAIVETLGGAIRAEGKPGEGSTFTFIIPKEASKKRGN